MRQKALLLVLCLLSSVLMWGQTRKVTGRVTKDGTQEAVPGASVTVKGTQTATSTDNEGQFSIAIPDRDNVVLVFTSIGFQAREVAVGKNTTVNVSLVNEASTLNDVVVIGYGKAKKGDLTGSVGVLGGKELAKTPVANAAEALTGKVAGLQVVTTEGSPDAEIKIRLRGGGSISQDNSPLYVVDGFPVSSISNIASSDIENITFLKDAASTAIFGSRASNGVILITTKEGKAGKISVTANAYAGFRKITKELDVLDPYQYVLYQYELDQTSTFQNYYGAYQDLDIYKSVQGRNWQREVFGRNAKQQYFNIGVSGGSKTTRFNLGLTRNDEQSVMLGSGYERNNLNFKINSDITSKLSFDFNTRLSYMLIDGAGVNTGSGANTRLRNSVKYAPTRGLRGFDQSDVDDANSISPESASLLFDPVESALDEYKKQSRLSSNFNGGLTWKILNGLSLRSEGGYEFRNNRTDNVWGPTTSNARNYAGQPIGNVYTMNGHSYRISNFVTLDKPNFISGHNLNVVLGQELLSDGYKQVINESRFFPVYMKAGDVLANMNFGTPIPTVTYTSQNDRMSSFFGRVNYNLFNKYLLTVTARADGSSKFKAGNRWSYFPSTALAWKISEEDFMEATAGWLNQLKLRASFGTTGNNKIPDNAHSLLYNTSDENKPYYLGESTYNNLIPGNYLYNPDLKWETTLNRNAGLDFTVFRSRLNGSVDLYWNTTKDLLVQFPIPTGSGYSFQYRNMGQTSNKGIELSLDGILVNKKDFTLSAAFNIGFNKNNVDEFRNGDVNFKTYTSGWNGTAQPLEDYLIQQGQPVGQMYGYVTDGMYTFDDFTFNVTDKRWVLNTGVADNSGIISATSYFGPGTLKFRDVSGADGKPDGKINSYDKTVIGNANAKHIGGFNLSAKYKGLDFQANFNWSYGNDVYNANKLDFSAYLLSRKYQNLVADMDLAHRFTIIDPVTGYNVAYGNNANPERLREINQSATIWHPIMTQTPLHSWAIEDGSFLRLNTLTLGYSLPSALLNRVKMNTVRLYVSAYNLYTLTDYSGYDPEVDTRRNPPVTPGVDYSAYPKSRSFVGGINITF